MWSLLWALRPAGDGETPAKGAIDRAAADLTEPPPSQPGSGERSAAGIGEGVRAAAAAPAGASRASSRLAAMPPAVVRADGGTTRVSVSVCPGGAFITSMSLERAAAQFDLASALRFSSRVEAEIACAGLVGFLLEVASHEAEPTILFARTLRD